MTHVDAGTATSFTGGAGAGTGDTLGFLSAEWMRERMTVAEVVEPTPGVDLVIQHRVLGGPRGPVDYVDYVRDGRLADCRLGEDTAADVTIVNTWSDELGVMRGEVDPFDIIIDGRVQVIGDQARLLPVVSILQRPLTREMAQTMTERTTETGVGASDVASTPC